MRNSTRRLTALALTTSFALILSFIESRIPTFVPIPGVKVGLANIAVIFALYKFGIWEAVAISGVRVILSSMLFGTPVSLIYSITGATVSLAVMFILKKFTPLSTVTVSVAGGVMHNVGQILMAMLVLAILPIIAFYLIGQKYIISGVIAGAVKG